MLVILRGGAHDGKVQTVADEVTTAYLTSEAPGLIDVYERVEELVDVPDNAEQAVVFELTGQEPAERFAPEMLHMPHTVSGDSEHDPQR